MPEVLTWEYRLPMIIAEVAESGADVVCLQEANHFGECLSNRQQDAHACTWALARSRTHRCAHPDHLAAQRISTACLAVDAMLTCSLCPLQSLFWQCTEQVQAELEQLGYRGCFMAKRPAPAERYGCPADGVALFWRPKRFTLLGEPICK